MSKPRCKIHILSINVLYILIFSWKKYYNIILNKKTTQPNYFSELRGQLGEHKGLSFLGSTKSAKANQKNFSEFRGHPKLTKITKEPTPYGVAVRKSKNKVVQRLFMPTWLLTTSATWRYF